MDTSFQAHLDDFFFFGGDNSDSPHRPGPWVLPDQALNWGFSQEPQFK